ncbi:MAG: alpha/beta fold hydrolase [Gemmobacter sp.]|nr:alpha/beta fold hydrolase [Gemmobacter sp.]
MATAGAHMDVMEEVLIAPPLRIRFCPGMSRLLVVSLAGVGTKPSEEPPVEFFRLAGAGGVNPVLFVSDESRSWLNAPDMADMIVAAIEATARFLDAERIVLLGNSMGATMALHLAHLTRVDRVIAFVPQVSVHPEDVPEEKRWTRFRKRITQWTYRKVEAWPTVPSVFVLHGGTDDELAHALRFPVEKDNVAHFILPTMDHNLARSLHKKGLLAEVVTDMMRGDRLAACDIISRAGGMLRQKFEDQRKMAKSESETLQGNA